jgi:branched-subunit amino acid aminotransferase/4-amino-4-deoxychorismate lyase
MIRLDGARLGADEAGAMVVLNYGHFTTMRSDGGRVKGLSWHLERLVRDCELIFGKTLDAERVRRLLRQVADDTVDTAGAVPAVESVLLRATVFDPTLLSDQEPRVLVTTRAPTSIPAGRDDQPAAGPRLRTVDYARDLPTVKHLGFFGPLHERRLAQLAGFDDALFTRGGRVCEGPTWNIAVLLGDELVWPDDNCLPGITRILVQRIMDDAGLAWSVRSVSVDELAQARAAFITSSGIGVHPVSAIDGVRLPGDPDLLKLIRTGYADLPADLI